MESPTNIEKLQAMEGLRTDVMNFVKAREKQDLAQHKILVWLKWLSLVQLLVFLIATSITFYLLTRPESASDATTRLQKQERTYLENERKLNNYERDDIKEARIQVLEMIKDIRLVDSLRKLK